MMSSAETIIHEFYAHGLPELKNKKRDVRKEHTEYGCADPLDAYYSLSIKTIYQGKHKKNDDEKNKFNKTPFGKAIQELEQNVDRFTPKPGQ